MEKEKALWRAVSLTMAATYGGMISYFITKFIDTLNFIYFLVLLGFSLFVLVYFYFLFRKAVW